MNGGLGIGDVRPGPGCKRRGTRPCAGAWGSDRGVACLGSGLVAAAALLMWISTAGAGATGDAVNEGFVEYVAGCEQYGESVRTFIARRWAQRQETGDTGGFVLEALALLSKEFRSGLEAFNEDRYVDCSGRMGPLTQSLDPYLAANAAVYEIKALVAADDLEQAESKIAALLALPRRVEQYTHSATEIHYLKGYCELGNLKYAEATRSLLAMLERFQDAPQRLRVTAQQMLDELRQRVPDSLDDVTDLMNYATRRLASSDTGQRVQDRQGRAIQILDKLIEEAGQREQNSAGGGGGSQSQPRSTPSRPQQPMQDSHLPQGSAPQQPQLRQRVVQPGQAWGAMKPAERERVLQVLKDSFPDRYRRLVEQYYQQLAQEP